MTPQVSDLSGSLSTYRAECNSYRVLIKEIHSIVNDIFDRDSCNAGVGEQHGERRLIFIEFIL